MARNIACICLWNMACLQPTVLASLHMATLTFDDVPQPWCIARPAMKLSCAPRAFAVFWVPVHLHGTGCIQLRERDNVLLQWGHFNLLGTEPISSIKEMQGQRDGDRYKQVLILHIHYLLYDASTSWDALATVCLNLSLSLSLSKISNWWGQLNIIHLGSKLNVWIYAHLFPRLLRLLMMNHHINSCILYNRINCIQKLLCHFKCKMWFDHNSKHTRWRRSFILIITQIVPSWSSYFVSFVISITNVVVVDFWILIIHES